MVRLPRYKPGDRIGQRFLVHRAVMGGMGEVYLCLDLKERHPIALKTFQERYLASRAVRDALEREARVWIALGRHPNVVRCFLMMLVEGLPYLHLEWVASNEDRGTDLRSWLGHGPLNTRLALRFAIDICRGLAHAGTSQPGIVHLDLKPENVLVGPKRTAKISDWGLARVLQQAAATPPASHDGVAEPADARAALVGGTPPYMAPERWRAEAVDCRADIYSVGCIFHEMLTGRAPFESSTREGYRTMHLGAAVPRLPMSGAAGGAMNRVLQRCLAKDRDERFDTAEELLGELSSMHVALFGEAPPPMAAGPGEVAMDYAGKGLTYHLLGQYDEALAEHHRAIELDSSYEGHYSNRGVTYYRLKRYDEALADHNHAVALNPSDAECYMNRGNLLADLKRHEDALADFTRAIRLDPSLAIAYSNRALTYCDLSRYDEALADLSRALQMEPTTAVHYYNRASVHAKGGRVEEALTDLTRAIDLDPIDARFHKARGILLFVRGLPREAQQCFERALEHGGAQMRQELTSELRQIREALPPRTGPEWEVAGLMSAMASDYEEAIRCFDQGIALQPGAASLWENKSTALLQLRRTEEALECADRALVLQPGKAHPWVVKGNLMGVTGRYREALVCFERALAIDPAHRLAREGKRQALSLLQRAGLAGNAALADTARAQGNVAGAIHGHEASGSDVPRPLVCPRCGRRFSEEEHRVYSHWKAMGVEGMRTQCPGCSAVLLLDCRSDTAKPWGGP